ncbi:MAG: alpha/beta hydrolase [Polyangia bacterium]
MQPIQQNGVRPSRELQDARRSLPAALYERCEPFFSRFSLSGLDWGDVILGTRELDPQAPGIDWNAWYSGFWSLASQHAQHAETAISYGRYYSARQLLLRASACAHFAEFMHFEQPEAKQQARHFAAHLFRRALPYMRNDVAIEMNRVAGGAVWILRRRRDRGGQPCVVLVNGLDSMNEVELYGFSRAFLDRGLAVLLFEGPGQGLRCGVEALPVDFETLMGAVLSCAQRQPAIDCNKLGVFGVSFGGYLAARCAALFPQSFRACINLSGGFDYDHFESMPPLVRRNFRFVFRKPESEIADFARTHLNLRGIPRMRAALLSIHGERDVVVPIEPARRLFDWAAGDKDFIYYSDERHVCTNSFPDLIPRMADWMTERLS